MKTRSFSGSSVVHSVAIAAAAVVVAAPAAARAQYSSSSAREVFEWQGHVDREVHLLVRDNRVVVRRVGSTDTQYGSTRVVNALPRQDGYLRVERLDGRGSVDVIEQPTSSNNYTGVVRLVDPSSGAGNYRIVTYWEPTRSADGTYGRGSAGTYDPNGTYGRDDRGDRDGRYDRDRDDRDGRYDRDRDDRDRDRRDFPSGTYDRNGNGKYEPGDHRGNSGKARGHGRGKGRGNGRGKGQDARRDDDRDYDRDYDRSRTGSGRYGSGTGALRWSGDVDGTVQIQLRDQRATTTNLGGKSVRNVSSSVSGAGLPSRAAQLAVRIREGRGTVSVVQQPSAENGYTGVVRVSDPAGGYGHYDFDVIWR